MEASHPDIVLTGEGTPKVTGAFEVIAKKTGKTYHSKLNGGGYLDNDQKKIDAMIVAVRADFPKAA